MRRVSDHLTSCGGCREEEQQYRSIKQASYEMKIVKVSQDFNNQLLDRVARERFVETRTKAYMPKPAPSWMVRRLIPVLATAFVAVFAVFAVFNDTRIIPQGTDFAIGSDQSLSDDYLTAQPTNNPNMASMLRKGWSLDDELERSERINRITQQLTFDLPFNYYGQSNAVNVSTRTNNPVPFIDGFYRVRPVFNVFEAASPNINQEATVTY
jgi:hypothetical protein